MVETRRYRTARFTIQLLLYRALNNAEFIDVRRLNFRGVFPYTNAPGTAVPMAGQTALRSKTKNWLPTYFGYGFPTAAPTLRHRDPPPTPPAAGIGLWLGEVETHFLKFGEV